MNFFRSLKHRPFAFLWSGQTTSRLGNNLYRIALAWWVLEKTGSAAAMGTVLIFSSVPMLVFLLIGGVVTDRFPRLRVMLIADMLSGSSSRSSPFWQPPTGSRSGMSTLPASSSAW